MTVNWYLLQTKTNAHRIATRNLLRQGCQVFMPLIKLTRRTGNRFNSNVSPLFPGYLFVGLGSDRAAPLAQPQFNAWCLTGYLA
jgi:transcriptional antiterminator RfaH